MAIRLEDGTILKIVPGGLPPGAGSRPVDLPILERGKQSTADGTYSISYFVQPEVEPPPHEMWEPFVDHVHRLGFTFIDPAVDQVGLYNGEARLLDPWAVVPRDR